MIFKRREKQTTFSKIRNVIWPKMGWKRMAVYYKHRILRMPHSTHDLAMGLTSGCVVSFTPTWGIQIVQCYIFCKIVKANFPAALLGTTFGNPWTFPVLIWISYTVGDFFLNVTGLDKFIILMAGKTEFLHEEGYGMKAFIPTLVGGYLIAALTFPLFYYAFYYLITAGRASRQVVSKGVHTIIDHRHEKKEAKRERKNK